MDQMMPMDAIAVEDTEYEVLRYAAPETKDDWVALLQLLLGSDAATATKAYDAMFPEGYDPDGTHDVALRLVDDEEDTDDWNPEVSG